MTDFLSALGSNHKVVSRAWLYYANQLVFESPLPVTGGSVTIDGTRAVRRSCSVQLVGVSDLYIPKAPGDRLSPYGAEIQLERGIVLDGQEVMASLGRFRISDADVENIGRGVTIDITGYDRSRSIARARFERPYPIAPGTNVATAIADLLYDRMPGITLIADDTDAVTPLLVYERQDDPWDKAQDLAKSIAMELYFDPLGRAVLRRIDDSGNAVDRYVEGPESKITKVAKSLSDEQGYSGIVVEGNPPGVEPVYAVVWDDTPGSPTNSAGEYGKVPEFYSSPLIGNELQAYQAAFALRRQQVGGTEKIRVEAIPNPQLDANRIIEIESPQLGISGYHYTSVIQIPLEVGGVMTIDARKLR